MNDARTSFISLPRFHLWNKLKQKRALVSFDIEITSRCNNNCRHCYINLPENDPVAKGKELALAHLKEIVDEAVTLGALWCLITGGEPLLRDDFIDIYLYLKKKGLLVSIFTNATLITKTHVKLFKQYPPRNLEVSVYGVTQETYERVTRKPGSFTAFLHGLHLLLDSRVSVRLKAMAIRSNFFELQEIAGFCREKTVGDFRFDPFLHLRFDGDPIRNRAIKAERLTPKEITCLESSDPQRLAALKKECDNLIVPSFLHTSSNTIFQCSAGMCSFNLSFDGLFRLCSSLWNRDCVYDLKAGTLTEAWYDFAPRVRKMRSQKDAFLTHCRICPFINLCMWCPAHAHLESGQLDQPVDYFCQVARARAQAFGDNRGLERVEAFHSE